MVYKSNLPAKFNGKFVKMRKEKIYNIIFYISIGLIVIMMIYGVITTGKAAERAAEAPFAAGYDEDEIYHINARTLVDFSEPIIEQFNKESQLVVSSVDASIELNLKQTGVLDIGVLNKTQKIKYKGTGRFYVNLSEMENITITMDEENKVIRIAVPHTELMPVEIDPNRFESEDAKKGLLAFGDLKFTPLEYNNLQIECKTKLESKINTKENRIKADENALEEIVKIYDPIVKAVDKDYCVEAEFIDKLGEIE